MRDPLYDFCKKGLLFFNVNRQKREEKLISFYIEENYKVIINEI